MLISWRLFAAWCKLVFVIVVALISCVVILWCLSVCVYALFDCACAHMSFC